MARRSMRARHLLGGTLTMYMKVDGIKGPQKAKGIIFCWIHYSPDPLIFFEGFEGSFTFIDYSWGFSGGSRIVEDDDRIGIDRPSISHFNVMKLEDETSPFLMALVASRKPVRHINVWLVDEDKNILTHYRFRDCGVSSVQWSGSSGDRRPCESLSFSFMAFDLTLNTFTRKPIQKCEEVEYDADTAKEALAESPFANFSTELAARILSHLPSGDTHNFAMTCKFFYDASASPLLLTKETNVLSYDVRSHKTHYNGQDIPDYNGRYAPDPAKDALIKEKEKPRALGRGRYFYDDDEY